VMPFLLWGFLIAVTRAEKYRMGVALLTCGALLYTSLSRASMLAAFISCTALCVLLRRQRVLIEGIFALVLLLAIAAVAQPAHFEQFTNGITNDLLYKGKKQKGILGSRKGPWEDTVASLKQHPWFGSGFGTSDLGMRVSVTRISALEGVYTEEGKNREHGNSY